MSVDAIISKLVEAESALLEWGKQEKYEMDLINKAYKAILEVKYMLQTGQVSLPKEKKEGIKARLERAIHYIKEALGHLKKGKSNPANIEVGYAAREVHSIVYGLLKERAEELSRRIEEDIAKYRELTA